MVLRKFILLTFLSFLASLVVLSMVYAAEGGYTCYSDAACADSDTLTYDQCINPGTAASTCRHTTINCASELDCGGEGFVGENFCHVDHVYGNYKNATCMYAGTPESFCVVEVLPQQRESCSAGCTNGSCIGDPQPVCGNSALEIGEQCDDGNTQNDDGCSAQCSVEGIGVSIAKPVEGQTFNSSLIPLEYSTEGQVSSCSYILNSGQEVSLPSCTNTSLQLWEGNHQIQVIVRGNQNRSASDTKHFLINLSSNISQSAPTVTLISPIGNTTLNHSSISLVFKAEDADGIDYCDVWHTFGGGFSKNLTLSNVSDGVQQMITYNLSEGNYKWNVFCVDRTGHGDFAVRNETFNINLSKQPPSKPSGGGGTAKYPRQLLYDERPFNYSGTCKYCSADPVYNTTTLKSKESGRVVLGDVSEESYARENSSEFPLWLLVIMLVLGIVLLLFLLILLAVRD